MADPTKSALLHGTHSSSAQQPGAHSEMASAVILAVIPPGLTTPNHTMRTSILT